MGTLLFDRCKLDGQLQCRVMASNYYYAPRIVTESQQHCSLYFVSIQRLSALRPGQLDAETQSRINEVIHKTISQLNLTRSGVVYCE
jgi:hypothetical protein